MSTATLRRDWEEATEARGIVAALIEGGASINRIALSAGVHATTIAGIAARKRLWVRRETTRALSALLDAPPEPYESPATGRIDLAELVASTGGTRHEMAMRDGASWESIQRDLYRKGRGDLVARMVRNEKWL